MSESPLDARNVYHDGQDCYGDCCSQYARLSPQFNELLAERDALRAFVDKIKAGEFDSFGDVAWEASKL